MAKRGDRPQQYPLRLKAPLHNALQKAAEARGISMNAEIIARLEWSLDRERILGDIDSALASDLGDEAALDDVVSKATFRRVLERAGRWTERGNDPLAERALRAILAQYYYWIGGGTEARVQSVLNALAQVDRLIDECLEKSKAKGRKQI